MKAEEPHLTQVTTFMDPPPNNVLCRGRAQPFKSVIDVLSDEKTLKAARDIAVSPHLAHASFKLLTDVDGSKAPIKLEWQTENNKVKRDAIELAAAAQAIRLKNKQAIYRMFPKHDPLKPHRRLY